MTITELEAVLDGVQVTPRLPSKNHEELLAS